MTARVEAIQPVGLADEDEEAGNTEPGKPTALLVDLERWTAEAAELRDSLEALLEAVEGASWRGQFATQELEGSAEPFDRLRCWEELSGDPAYESGAALIDALRASLERVSRRGLPRMTCSCAPGISIRNPSKNIGH